MLTRAPGLLFLTLMLAPAAALAQVSAATPIVSSAAEPVQFYVFSFNETSAAEAAQDVVVSALGYELDIDPATPTGVVTFSADGHYSGPALLQDFGSALLDQDIALIRVRPGVYTLAPRMNAPILIARGGVLMALPSPTASAGPAGAASEASPVPVYGRARWWDGAMGAMLLFFAGAFAGAAALFGGQAVYRRSPTPGPTLPPVLRLADQREHRGPSVETADADIDLVIPSFETRHPV